MQRIVTHDNWEPPLIKVVLTTNSPTKEQNDKPISVRIKEDDSKVFYEIMLVHTQFQALKAVQPHASVSSYPNNSIHGIFCYQVAPGVLFVNELHCNSFFKDCQQWV